jgi:hypothetical protein
VALDGLGHEEIDSTTYGYYGPMTTKTSSGKRYRKFKVKDGSVKIETSITGTASGTSYISVASGYQAAESPWAVGITSDRGETFRRVATSGLPKRVSNYFEDDETTLRGGDGVVYGDSVQTEPNPFLNGNEWDFATTFTMFLEGPWSVSTVGSHKASPSLGGGGNFFQLGEFWGVRNTVGGKNNTGGAKDVPFTDTGSALDSTNSISDSCVYKMRAHLPGENKETHGSTGYVKLYTVKTSLMTDYPIAHSPIALGAAIECDALATKPLEITYTVSDSLKAEEGWETSSSGGGEISAEVIKLNFSDTFKTTGSFSVDTSATTGIKFEVQPGRIAQKWIYDRGTVTRYWLPRYNDQGYTHDSVEFVLGGDYKKIFKITEGPAGQQVPLP